MSDAPDVSCRKRPKAALVRDVLFVVGLAILATLSWQIGLPQILTYLQPLGWRFVLVFLAYLLVFVCDTLGWRYAFTRMPPLGFPRLLALQIVGKAANLMTPLLPVGGEPLKAYLLHVRGVPLAEGLASVVVARTLATVANGLFVLGVTGVIVVQLGLPVSLLDVASAGLAGGGSRGLCAAMAARAAAIACAGNRHRRPRLRHQGRLLYDPGKPGYPGRRERVHLRERRPAPRGGDGVHSPAAHAGVGVGGRRMVTCELVRPGTPAAARRSHCGARARSGAMPTV